MAASQGRFLVSERLRIGSIRLDREQAAHLRVMRLQPGARIAVFDGRGHEGEATVRRVGVDDAEIEIESVVPVGRPALEIWLVQALPTKLPRMDTIVRLGAELGVGTILPVIAARTQLPGGGAAVLERRAGRWRRLAEAASKQSRAALIPEIEDALPFAELSLDATPEPRLLLDPAAPAGALTSALQAPSTGATTLLIGPEGGWTAEEIERCRAHGAHPVGLGPRTLRADTAGAIAAAAVQRAWGDLR